MSIVKELSDERFQERLDTTFRTYVKNMSRDGLEHRVIGSLDDYYNNVATQEEREEFLREHEELPF
jgi:chemotaxis methyl-accepting protein methylase